MRTVHRYLGRRVDAVIVNTAAPTAELTERYADEGSAMVVPDLEAVRALVPQVRAGQFASTEPLMRHDAERVVLGIWPELEGEGGFTPRSGPPP